MELSNLKYLILIVYFFIFFRTIMLNFLYILINLFIFLFMFLPKKFQIKISNYDNEKIGKYSYNLGKFIRKTQKFVSKIFNIPYFDIFDILEKNIFKIYKQIHKGFYNGFSKGVSNGIKTLHNNNRSNGNKQKSFTFIYAIYAILLIILVHLLLFLPTIIGIILIIIIL